MDKTIPYTLKGANPMKTKKELNALTEEAKTVSKDLRELTDEELEQVIGGTGFPFNNLGGGLSANVTPI